MTNKSRIEKLEDIIKPKDRVEVKHFMITDYKDRAEMDQAVEAWVLPEGVRGIVIEHILVESAEENQTNQTEFKESDNTGGVKNDKQKQD